MKRRVDGFSLLMIIISVFIIGSIGFGFAGLVKDSNDFIEVEVKVEYDDDVYSGLMSKYAYEMWVYGEDDMTIELRGAKDYRLNPEHIVSIAVLGDWEE